MTPGKPSRSSVAVVGAGLTGLTVAYRLALQGHDVHLFESGGGLGGLAGGFKLRDGTPLERAYHFLYKTDSEILALAEELGIRDNIQFHASSIAAIYNAKIYPFMTAKDLLLFSPLSFVDRLRTGLVALFLRRTTRWQALSRVTAYSWLRRYNGKKATDILWMPLLKGKFDRYFDQVSMAWLWRRIQTRIESRDPGDAQEKLGYPRGGFQLIIEKIENRLLSLGVSIKLNTKLTAIGFDSKAGKPYLNNGTDILHFDAVAATIPNGTFAKLIKSDSAASADYIQQLVSTEYLTAVVLVFTTSEPISNYFWHQIHEVSSPFLVLLSLSSLAGTEQFGGKHVYYIGDYVPAHDKLCTMSEEQIRDKWLIALSSLMPKFDRSTVLESYVFKHANAQHIPGVCYEQKIASQKSPLQFVYLSNFAQIYPDDRGTNYAVRDGNKLAQNISKDLAAT